MEILNTDTKEVVEIVADYGNGIDQLPDIENGADFKYNKETGMHEADTETINWWSNYIDTSIEDKYRLDMLMEKYPELADEIEDELNYGIGGVDMESEHSVYDGIFRDYAEESSPIDLLPDEIRKEVKDILEKSSISKEEIRKIMDIYENMYTVSDLKDLDIISDKEYSFIKCKITGKKQSLADKIADAENRTENQKMDTPNKNKVVER